MNTTKQLGIWMDHSVAHLIKLSNGSIETNTIESQPEIQADQQIVYKDESHSLNKEKRQLTTYFRKLSDLILENDEVILFGPTEAKNELLNVLKENHLFDKIKIEVEPTDKMTEIQMNDFVKEHFK
jgi:stalled ribosome rescue protein Dom34